MCLVRSARGVEAREHLYLIQSIFRVVLQMSTPPQIRQLILYYHYYKEKFDDLFVGIDLCKMTFKTLCVR